MAIAENPYSQFVSWMKIILPLAAIGLLSTLFLFAKSPIDATEIPYADIDIEGLTKDQRISAPYYAGVTEDGASFAVSATSARPDPEDDNILTATDLMTEIVSAKGTTVEITASIGIINNTDQTARITGLARIETSDGIQVETFGLQTWLDTGRVESEGAVEARTPEGPLTAGQFIIEPATDTHGRLVVFKEGVTLVYTPNP